MDNDQKTLIDNVSVAIFVLERNTENQPVYIALNEYACRKAGLSLSDVLGKTAKEIYPGRFGQLAYENHCACLLSGQATTYDLKLSLSAYNAHIKTNLSPIKDKNGQVIRIVGTSTTANAENIIREAHEKSILQNSEIEKLVHLSAHDLRSPMRNVKQLTEILADNFVDLGDGKLKLVEMLKKVSDSTFALIDNILDYARATGSTESIEDFELAPLCREILSMLDPSNMHTANIENVSITGDKMATQITLRNLIDNAFKHNHDPVEISIKASKPKPGYFQIAVADSGIGSKNPQKLFEQNAPQKIDDGHGLRGVTRMLNKRSGEISAATPKEGHGMVVQFSLPGKIIDKS